MNSAVDTAPFETAGLYDPRAPNAADRLELLRFLVELGVTIDEMVAANSKGRLVGLSGDRAIRPGPHRLTRVEVAELAGVPLALAERVWQAAGFPSVDPDVADFDETDVETLSGFAVALQVFDEDVILQLTRVLSSSLARSAEAFMAAVGSAIDRPLMERQASEVQFARQSAENAALLPLLFRAIENLTRRHLEVVNDMRFEAAFPSTGSDTVPLAVGFADLVGSTAWARGLPVSESGRALSRFEGLAADTIADHGARLVKLIGDEVMFVAVDPADACRLGLDLIDAVRAVEELPPLRAGLAYGDVAARAGDYHGPVVNLASRVVGVARPGRLLVTAEVRKAATAAAMATAAATTTVEGGAELRFRPAGAHRLRGFGGLVRLYHVALAAPRGIF